MAQNKNDSINSILQHGRVVYNLLSSISYFRISLIDSVPDSANGR